MKTLDRLLTGYTGWLCRTFGVGPSQIAKARVQHRCDAFAPRPKGALGFYY